MLSSQSVIKILLIRSVFALKIISLSYKNIARYLKRTLNASKSLLYQISKVFCRHFAGMSSNMGSILLFGGNYLYCHYFLQNLKKNRSD